MPPDPVNNMVMQRLGQRLGMQFAQIPGPPEPVFDRTTYAWGKGFPEKQHFLTLRCAGGDELHSRNGRLFFATPGNRRAIQDFFETKRGMEYFHKRFNEDLPSQRWVPENIQGYRIDPDGKIDFTKFSDSAEKQYKACCDNNHRYWLGVQRRTERFLSGVFPSSKN